MSVWVLHMAGVLINAHQAAAFQRDAAARTSIDADEVAQARAHAEETDPTREEEAVPGEVGGNDQDMIGLVKTKIEIELKLMSRRS